jgi:anti-sigma factor RsiW
MSESCREWRGPMLDLLEGELENDASAAARVRAHLDACPACAAEYASLRRTLALLEHRPRRDDAERDWDALRRRVHAGIAAKPQRRRFRPAPILAATAAAAALALVLLWGAGLLTGRGDQRRVLAQIEASGRQALVEGRAASPQLMDAVLAEDYPVDADVDQLIEDLSAGELTALAAQLETLKG